jgi:ER membrane protein SH3
MAKGARSFATFMILCRRFPSVLRKVLSRRLHHHTHHGVTNTYLIATSFFLGLLFSSFPYDYPLLWTSEAPTEAYIDFLEKHLQFMHASPPIIARILHIMIGLGLCGFLIKLYRPSESNLLFDGASLSLFVIAVVMYITNIVKGLRIITAETYGGEAVSGESDGHYPGWNEREGPLEVGVGREDSLKVMAASNTILALVLVGVLVLQAGQWYAERKDEQEEERFEVKETAKKATSTAKPVTRSGSKKKQ